MNCSRNLIYQTGNTVVTELFPFFTSRRIFYRLDIDTAFSLEIGYTFVAVTIIGCRIFFIHHQTIFIPKSTCQNYIDIANIIQMNEINFGNLCNLTIFSNQIIDYIRIVRTHTFIIRNICLHSICRLAFTVYRIPGRICIPFQHCRNPCMILQSGSMSYFCSTSMFFYIETTRIITHTYQPVVLPFFEIGLYRRFCSLLTFSLPTIYRNSFH